MLTGAHGKQILLHVFLFLQFLFFVFFYALQTYTFSAKDSHMYAIYAFTQKGREKEHICSTLTAATFPSNHPSL